MITGGLVVLIYKWARTNLFAGSIFDIYELLPAFVISIAVIILVSLLTKKPDDEVINKFDEVKSICKK